MTLQDKNQTTKNPLVILIAGPAGTGKSTLASIFVDLLNERLVRSQGTSGKSKGLEDTNDSTRLESVTFLEGDELHSSENIQKMAQGIPLTDQDRYPWLLRVATETCTTAATNSGIVIGTCSALKKEYRDFLRTSFMKTNPAVNLVFVFLCASEQTLVSRILHRQGHYMGAEMVKSQLAIMQVPTADDTNAGLTQHDGNGNSSSENDCIVVTEKDQAMDKLDLVKSILEKINKRGFL